MTSTDSLFGPQPERQVVRFRALQQLLLDIAAGRSLADLLQRIVSAACGLCNANSGTIYRWDPARELLQPACNWNVPASDTTPATRPGEGLSGLVWQRGEVVIVNDYLSWPGAMQSGLRGGLLAGCCAPLMASGRQLGVLLVRRYGPGPDFTAEDGQFLEMLGAQAAHLLEREMMIEDRIAAERERARLEGVVLTGRGIAHQMNQDLGVIVGRVELLRSALRDRPSLQPSLDAAFAAAQRLAERVRLLQSASRIVTRETPGVGEFLDIDASAGDTG